MARRAAAAPGQSYLDANEGRVMAVDRDVLDIKRRIEHQWPDLTVAYDQFDEEFVVIQKYQNQKGEWCEALALKADVLDERLIERLHEADPTSRNFVDPLDHIDKHNAEIERDRDRKFSDAIGEAGEKLIHAFKKDGIDHHDNIEAPIRPHHARRAVNREPR